MYEIKYLQNLFITVLIETIFLFISVRFIFKIKKSNVNNRLIILAGILCSSVTLPYIWFVLPVLIENYYVFMVIAEGFAIIAESIIIFYLLKLSLKKSFIISLICNIFSFASGELIKAVF